MKSSRINNLRTLGALLGLGLSLAFIGCSGETGDTSSSAASTSDAASTAVSSGSGSGSGGSGSSGSTSGSGGSGGAGGGASAGEFSFFVTSDKSTTANLGGLAGADKRCQDLAAAVGAGSKTWRAYLSVEKDESGQPVNARDRIGKGPWYNQKLELVAKNLDELHARFGDYTIFIDEKGGLVPGQWPNSPKPNEHDILTGTNRDGTLAVGKTCADWTSEDPAKLAVVGHSDGLGPMGSMDPMYRPWNSVHDNESCADTAPRGGAGRLYCFAAD